MTNPAKKWYCPVCGFDLTKDAHGIKEQDSTLIYDVLYTHICSSCGIEFGTGDFMGADLESDKKFYTNLRHKWIQGGMKWGWSFKHEKAFDSDKAPLNWNPLEQLKNVPKEFLSEGESY